MLVVFESTCWIMSPIIPTLQSDTPPMKRILLPIARLVQKPNILAVVYSMRIFHLPAVFIFVASEPSSGVFNSTSNDYIVLGVPSLT